MGRGDRSKVRWRNDRVKKKKARDRRAPASNEVAQEDADSPS
ncbi:MAG TPA: hypothetical protein VK988_19370 [Acidimicrobiales bacterium]|nr:hypothetical protein [Acidimicrobiales bacterium]